MKTYKNLYDNFSSFSNLLIAFKKAFRGTKSLESYSFMFHLENEILSLMYDLQKENYKPEPYRYFNIYEPKERVISVATFRDRVVHHAIVNVLEPIYEPLFIFHSYATRKRKGTHKAVLQAQKYLKKNFFFLKCDIKKFFYSIEHQIIIDIIKEKIKDRKLMNLIEKIIYNAGDNIGLPIGNLTSQFFANVFLNDFDHYVKRELKEKFYLRYMDDFVIFSNNKQHLKEVLVKIRQYLLENRHLQLKEKAVLINTAMHGLSFLGTRIFPKTIRIKQENLKRSYKKLKYKYYLYSNKKISQEEYLKTANSIFAHLRFYNTRNLLLKFPYIDAEM